MAATRFIVVRHGETAWNAQTRIQGHLDSPLNEEGMAQALLLAERLAQEPFDHFYASDLGRALQTAQPLADRTGKQPIPNRQLRERSLGIFQGLTSVECERAYPEDYGRFHGRDPDHAMPGGESIRELNRRVASVFEDLASRHAGECVLAVTHGGVLDALYRVVTRMPLDQPRTFPVYNASVNRVRREANGWVLESWGDISHLTRDAALDDF
jgi:2,3-bisphosphoglycerate-dependent phosphoglycerate mutase